MILQCGINDTFNKNHDWQLFVKNPSIKLCCMQSCFFFSWNSHPLLMNRNDSCMSFLRKNVTLYDFLRVWLLVLVLAQECQLLQYCRSWIRLPATQESSQKWAVQIYTILFCFDQFYFFPHIEGDGRTHEKHASPQRTWKPEGKVWEQSCILPFCAVYMSLSGRSHVLFFIQAECTIYIYA